MKHRHLDYGDDVSVNQRGLAALDDLLDRGDLADWAPLAAEIAAAPRGRLADAVLALCRDHVMYGTSPLWVTWIERLREGGVPREPIVTGLAEVRLRRGLRQVDVATAMGVSQSDISKLESRRDTRLSTLRAYLEAVGAELRTEAVFRDDIVGFEMPGDPDRPR